MAGLVQVVQEPISTAEPSEADQRLNDKLMKLMQDENLLPTEEEERLRVKVLGKLNEIVRDFIRRTLDRKGHSDLVADDTTYRLRTFGSYRLDVHLPGADMDTVVIVNKFVDRSDMFADLYVRLCARNDVKDLVKVEEARVPVIKFTMDDFEFDLAMARLPLATIPDDFNITDDVHLKQVDQQSVTSLNGVRVTDTIMTLVPTMATLKFAIRCLKLWAKRRGTYKNVLGFLGGISIEILAARIGQMYPKALPCKLISAFFLVYANWPWPMPVGLVDINPNSCDLGLPVWMCGLTELMDKRHEMPIITPVYPCQNATSNVSKSTLKIMQDEFARGRDICKKIEAGLSEWSELFEPLDVMNKYVNYLQIQIMTPNRADYDMWKGFTEANLRNVITLLERDREAYLATAHPSQRNFMKPRASDDDPYEHFWYVGLKFDMERIKKDKRKGPNITAPINDFKRRLLDWKRRKDGMSLFVTSCKHKNLPDFVLNPQETAEGEVQDQTLNEIIQGETKEEEAPAAPAGDVPTVTAAAIGAPGPVGVSHAVAEVKPASAESATVPPPPPAEVEAGSKRALEEEGGEQGEAKKRVKVEEGADRTGNAMATEGSEDGGRVLTATLMQGLAEGSEVRGDFKGGAGGGKAVECVKKIYVLEKCQELRVEVEGTPIVVVLETGCGEVFGAEMARGEKREISRAKFAIFTWQGCTVSIRGEARVVYVGETTPMKSYANVHGFIQERRQESRTSGARPPRTMVVGPASSGKTSLVKLLVNYAVRLGERPIYVDLSLKGSSPFLIPGTLGAAVMKDMLTLNEEKDDLEPLAYFYGFKEVEARPEFLKHIITSLSTHCKSLKKPSGIIIDTFPCGAGMVPSYEAIVYAAKAFEVDHVLVVEQDRIYNDLKRDLSAGVPGGGPGPTVVRVSKSGGVVVQEPTFVKLLEKQATRDYYYGRMRDLCPRPFVVPFSQLFLYSTVSAPPAPRDALPIGAVAAPREVEFVRVEPDESLEKRILGVSGQHRSIPGPLTESQITELAHGDCVGFAHVQRVDMINKRVTLLLPNGVGLPSNVMLVGEVELADS